MSDIAETLTGIVNRVTYHNPDNGWSVLRVQPLDRPGQQETVTVHQTQVFAGATMQFSGTWTINQKYGRQFQANNALEKKPATAASLEKYLGSGLIKGVGPKTAKKIVGYFKKDTLDVFEHHIERLTEVPGIAQKKLEMIETAWCEHRSIREVMMFLQSHGISSLFAVRIYKEYGDNAIQTVITDPYQLANDIYGIGFFSADKVALSLGLAKDSDQRIMAAIKQVLSASREQGHCYLTQIQIQEGTKQLIELDLSDVLNKHLETLQQNNQLRTRSLIKEKHTHITAYYSKTLFYDESTVAERLNEMQSTMVSVDHERVTRWIERYCHTTGIHLSEEQAHAATEIVQHPFSILTGGPGCGKTTTTRVIVRLLESMGRQVLLAAPTGRATQKMSEVIRREAKTLHRLLEWKMGAFQKNEETPLKADFLIIDECSMLDISLSAALLKATPGGCQVLFIGDADQLPSIGAGNVLRDIISSNIIPCFHLTQVFRQAQQSSIIRFAHQINQGQLPAITSPFKKPQSWENKTDCLFIDSDEATQAQLGFITRVKRFFDWKTSELEQLNTTEETPFEFRTQETIQSAYEQEFTIPKQFEHVQLDRLHKTDNKIASFKAVIKKIHPWSSLHYNLTCLDVIVKLYLDWIPKYHGTETEIQILTPMTRGSLGTANLNKVLQEKANPSKSGKYQLQIGERIFREGDRVIHRRNNYDLNVFNGDIGKITAIDTENLTCEVSFYPNSRTVRYKKEDLMELDLAYAITIHKSQGSEFKAVIIPVLTQHFKMLHRNLVYTGLTRAKKLAIFVGTRKALAMAIRQEDSRQRQTALKQLIKPNNPKIN